MGIIQIKIDKGQYNLVVVFNPLIVEDPRNASELWSKQFLLNTKKNSKYIDAIKSKYGSEVYDFISDASNSVYTYNFNEFV